MLKHADDVPPRISSAKNGAIASTAQARGRSLAQPAEVGHHFARKLASSVEDHGTAPSASAPASKPGQLTTAKPPPVISQLHAALAHTQRHEVGEAAAICAPGRQELMPYGVVKVQLARGTLQAPSGFSGRSSPRLSQDGSVISGSLTTPALALGDRPDDDGSLAQPAIESVRTTRSAVDPRRRDTNPIA